MGLLNELRTGLRELPHFSRASEDAARSFTLESAKGRGERIA